MSSTASSVTAASGTKPAWAISSLVSVGTTVRAGAAPGSCMAAGSGSVGSLLARRDGDLFNLGQLVLEQPLRQFV